MEEHMTENTDQTNDRIPDATPEQEHPEPQDDAFPRSYVEKLRDENAKYRQRAQRADELAHRLHAALVEATGALQDPTDLEFDEAHLEDPQALQDAVSELVASKPHLAARRPRGDVGQGHTTSSNPVDLAGILRARA